VQIWMVHHPEILGEACKSISIDARARHARVAAPVPFSVAGGGSRSTT